MSAAEETIDALCTRCGLCCDGTLFTSVVCATGTEARRVEAAGLSLNFIEGVGAFTQPCSRLKDTRCTFYADRPTRCRKFECELLKRTDRDEVSRNEAVSIIEQTQLKAEIIRSLLRGLGDEDETVPLAHRCDRVMELPVEKDEDWWETYATFLLEVRALQARLKHDFYESAATNVP
ncbi:MAG: YkgJ family cysteine cluster protein [Verrucomicrobiae bacterium]|jgi:hypothetical protein|nr:YkgJ family cysteine cluster protein [Verrucomicrobiae bacterium]